MGCCSTFRSETDLVAIHLVLLGAFLLGQPIQKSVVFSSVFQIGSGWNLAGLFFK